MKTNVKTSNTWVVEHDTLYFVFGLRVATNNCNVCLNHWLPAPTFTCQEVKLLPISAMGITQICILMHAPSVRMMAVCAQNVLIDQQNYSFGCCEKQGLYSFSQGCKNKNKVLYWQGHLRHPKKFTLASCRSHLLQHFWSGRGNLFK